MGKKYRTCTWFAIAHKKSNVASQYYHRIIEHIEIADESSMIRNNWLSVFVGNVYAFQISNLRAVFFVFVWTEQMNKRTFSCSYSSKFNNNKRRSHTNFLFSSVIIKREIWKKNSISDVKSLGTSFFIQTYKWTHIEVLVYFYIKKIPIIVSDPSFICYGSQTTHKL